MIGETRPFKAHFITVTKMVLFVGMKQGIVC